MAAAGGRRGAEHPTGCRRNRVADPGGPPMTIAPPTDPAPVQPGPASPTTVIGDGTTVTSRVRTRWERARWPITAVVVFLTVVLISSLLTARTSTVPLAPDNPGDAGARALAQILRDQGVRIEYVRSLGTAVAEARDGTTLLVTSTDTLFGVQLDELAQVEADLVLIDPCLLYTSPSPRDR